jgi:hypothetical protein
LKLFMLGPGHATQAFLEVLWREAASESETPVRSAQVRRLAHDEEQERSGE